MQKMPEMQEKLFFSFINIRIISSLELLFDEIRRMKGYNTSRLNLNMKQKKELEGF